MCNYSPLLDTGLIPATQSAPHLPFTLHPTPPPLLHCFLPSWTRIQPRSPLMLMIMSLGSSPDSSRLRSMLGCNKTPSITFSSSYSAYLAWGTHKEPKICPPHQPLVTLAAPALPGQARGLKPATPNDFDGDRLKGWAFLNSCRLYISLCESQFRDDQAMIHWALSFMKSGRAALYANHILQREASEVLPACVSWKRFELDFISKFCPKNEATVALTKLESARYYQGRKSVDVLWIDSILSDLY